MRFKRRGIEEAENLSFSLRLFLVANRPLFTLGFLYWREGDVGRGNLSIEEINIETFSSFSRSFQAMMNQPWKSR